MFLDMLSRIQDFKRSVAIKGTTVAAMRPGQVGYTLAGAIRMDPNGRYWLKPDYPISKRPTPGPGSRIEVRVERRWGGWYTFATDNQREKVHKAQADDLSLPTRLLRR